MSSCPKRGSAQRNCCYGWMASNNATKGPDALIRNAALPSAVTPPAYLHNRRCNTKCLIQTGIYGCQWRRQGFVEKVAGLTAGLLHCGPEGDKQPVHQEKHRGGAVEFISASAMAYSAPATVPESGVAGPGDLTPRPSLRTIFFTLWASAAM